LLLWLHHEIAKTNTTRKVVDEKFHEAHCPKKLFKQLLNYSSWMLNDSDSFYKTMDETLIIMDELFSL
jgi:hypothetical protein